MTRFVCTFKTVTPIMIGERGTSNDSKSLDYIPGEALRDGLAYAYLRRNALVEGEADKMFESLFLKGETHFGNLYPANFDAHIDGDIADDIPIRPLPRTARSCKRWPGFLYGAQDEDDERHGVTDHLMLRAFFETSGMRRMDLLNEMEYCPRCGFSLDRFSGFYGVAAPSGYGKANVNMRLVTGTGINRLTETVHEEILFSREVIAEVDPSGQEQLFQGIINVENDQAKTFFDLVNDDSLNIRVGQAKSRGFGSIRLTDHFPLPVESQDAFETRLAAFDECLKTQAKKREVEIEDAWYFSVTCWSEVILRTPDLRYRTILSRDELAELPQADRLNLIYHSASVKKISGWNSLWRLPKSIEIGIGKGSVFLFAYTAPPTPEFFQQLYRLEQRGLGVRREEGFGWMSVSDPFHLGEEPR